LPPKKRGPNNKVAVVFLKMKNRGLDVAKPLPAFKIRLEEKVKKFFAFESMYFYPCCRVFIVQHFASHRSKFLKVKNRPASFGISG
jgi:hypothetical protein